MTATLPLVKMAACSPVDGEGVDTKNISSTSSLQVPTLFVNNNQPKPSSSGENSKVTSLDGEKAYDAVASLEESDLKSFLEEVISRDRSKNDKSAIAQFLIRKEEDALREESGSGEDTIEQAFCKQKKKRFACKREHCESCSHFGVSASVRNNTGGSLGSLHNLSDPKIPEETTTHTQGVASRSRAGGSCGNLSKGSFETHACKRRNRRSKEFNKASASNREGGSLQNLSKTEVASNESKKLQKSGSLSQVFADIGGIRIKNRRQKTSSESSGRTYIRRSEEREAGAGVSSDEGEVGEFAYQRLVPSSHSSVSGHSGDPVEACGNGMVGATWNEDHDVASGETTEEDGELHHISARAKLGGEAGSRHHYHHTSHHHNDGSDTELHSVVTHSAHRDVLPTISSDSEVDKPIKFSLGNGSEENVSSLSSAPSYNESFVDGKVILKGSEPEVNEKRKLRSTKSDSASFEKSSLDENGNPVLMTVRNNATGTSFVNSASSVTSLTSSSASERHTGSSGVVATGKRNGFSAQTKDVSTYTRMKAKQDKRKAREEKDVMPSEKTPGFRGDDPLDTILKFLGADNSTNAKSKKKKEGAKKGGGKSGKCATDKMANEEEEEEDGGEESESNKEEGGGSFKREDESDTRQELKKGAGKRRGKKSGSSGLRESSSVEDLVSKSKQSDAVRGFRKQVTVDDGGVDLGSGAAYHGGGQRSEFSYDFYKVGDALFDPDAGPGENGDFEVVSRKRGKKAIRTASQSSRSGGSGGGWSSGSMSHSMSDDQRRATFPRTNVPGGGGAFGSRGGRNCRSEDKPEINFSEGPFTVHDGVFLSQFSGNRSGVAGERYTTTTSVPHSEDSDSDGGDSVHSMPAHTITPRPHVRKTPPPTDSTPQASYANIAKLAATANKAQMKRVAAANHSPGTGSGNTPRQKTTPPEEETSDKTSLDDSSTSHDSAILDDNFPPLYGASPLSPNAASANCNNNNNNISSKNSEKGNANYENIVHGSSKEQKATTHPSPSNDSSKASPANPHSDGLTSHGGQTVSQHCATSQKMSSFRENSSKVSPANPHSGGSDGLTAHVGQNVASQKMQPTKAPQNNPHSASIKVTQVEQKPNVPQSYPNRPNTAQKLLANGPINAQNAIQVNNNVIKSAPDATKTAPPTHNTPPPQLTQDNLQCQNRSACTNIVEKNSSDKNKNSTTRDNKGSTPRENTNKGGIISSKHYNRIEGAVIFTDNAKFDLCISDIEFGFGVSLENLSNLTEKAPDTKHAGTSKKKLSIDDKLPHLETLQATLSAKSAGNNNNNIGISSDNNKNVKNLQSSKKDYSKMFRPPTNDLISYNYEELCRHLITGWESTLRLMDEDPKNIQYWKPAKNNSLET